RSGWEGNLHSTTRERVVHAVADGAVDVVGVLEVVHEEEQLVLDRALAERFGPDEWRRSGENAGSVGRGRERDLGGLGVGWRKMTLPPRRAGVKPSRGASSCESLLSRGRHWAG